MEKKIVSELEKVQKIREYDESIGYWKLFFKKLGLVNMIWFTILFYATFMMAYFNDQKAVLVLIDKFVEANIEFVMLLLVAPLIVYGIYRALKENKR